MTNLQRLRNRSPQRARSTRQSGQFSPAYLAPYAWYDAHIGGSASGITDSSANARAAMTNGAGSNAALWLPYTRPGVYVPDTSASNQIFTNLSGANLTTARAAFDNQTLRVRSTFTPGSLGSGNRKDVGSFRAQGIVLYFTPSSRALEIFTYVVSPSIETGSVILDAPTDGTYYVEVQMSGNSFIIRQSADNGATYQTKGTISLTGHADPATAASITFGTHQYQSDATLHRLEYANGSTVFALFDAALTRQSGYTDAYGNVWLIFRDTSGRKAVVQSPATLSARNMFLLGPDDWLDVPAAAIPPTGAATSWTVVAVFRQWATQTTYGVVFSLRNGANTGPNIFIGPPGDPNTTLQAYDAGALVATNASVANPTLGTRWVVSGLSNGTHLAAEVNTVRSSLAVISASPYAGAIAGRVGAHASFGTGNQHFEFEALLMFNRALSAVDTAQLSAYYGGGL